MDKIYLRILLIFCDLILYVRSRSYFILFISLFVFVIYFFRIDERVYFEKIKRA